MSSAKGYLDFYKGKSVLITGGTGSIGSTILNKLYSVADSISILSRTEDNVKKLMMRFPLVNYILGDIRDYSSVNYAVSGCDVVISCAAMKHVDLCEKNPWEAVQTNIIGTHNLKRAALESRKVSKIVSISTDKAGDPKGVMGMTKYLQEKVLFNPSLAQSGISVVAVRPGNVLGSRGSVVEIFRRQKSEGLPVTITNPDMLRFVMTRDAVSDLILWAGSVDKYDKVYFSQMPTVSVRTIAEAVAGKDYPFTVVGGKKGEKIHENLYSDEERSKITILGTPIGLVGEIGALDTADADSDLLNEFSLGRTILTSEELRELL